MRLGGSLRGTGSRAGARACPLGLFFGDFLAGARKLPSRSGRNYQSCTECSCVLNLTAIRMYVTVQKLATSGGGHTFSPTRKYAKSRREPSAWFSDSLGGLRGKRIRFSFSNISAAFPLGIPMADCAVRNLWQREGQGPPFQAYVIMTVPYSFSGALSAGPTAYEHSVR